MKVNKVIFGVIVPVFLAIPCLYYAYLMLFNPIIRNLKPDNLALRLAEGQKSFNYTVWSLGKPAIILFAVYIVILLAALISAKMKKARIMRD